MQPSCNSTNPATARRARAPRAQRNGHRTGTARVNRAFTLIELLVVIAIVAILVSVLLPALAGARRSARAVKCLAQVHNLALAQALYAGDHRERLVDAGLAHGGTGDPANSWPVALSAYSDGPLALRSPADDSPSWATSQGGTFQGLTLAEFLERYEAARPTLRPGQVFTPAAPLARFSSYGLNNYLTRSKAPDPSLTGGIVYDRLGIVPRPSATAQWLIMTFGREGPRSLSFSRSDHVHAEDWGQLGDQAAPALASKEAQTFAHGGRPTSDQALSSYAFLDGHASTLTFRQLWKSSEDNALDPRVAR